ncbi:phosphoribosyltransferase [Pantoea sp. 18069]|uniref:phosphoribosyltransferase n=1 Tax=Pantoea sp. 18069 TaxID=2681415 RepID=UPI001357F879|nr:phosphoribosyltransferase [Pantoea sp. 18069]
MAGIHSKALEAADALPGCPAPGCPAPGCPAPGFDATTGYWQRIVAAEELVQPAAPPYQRSYPARLRDGRYLLLPLRAMPGDPARCMASLVANQAALDVVQALAQSMVEQARDHAVDAVVGLPTLGLCFAPTVARGLGHARFIPLGFSRKYWYREELSEPVRSITSPNQDKRLYLDPHQAHLLEGRRVLVVDDTVSSGATMVSSLRLLARCGAQVVVIAVAMRQGTRWRERLRDARGQPIPVLGALDAPCMVRTSAGWVPEA